MYDLYDKGARTHPRRWRIFWVENRIVGVCFEFRGDSYFIFPGRCHTFRYVQRSLKVDQLTGARIRLHDPARQRFGPILSPRQVKQVLKALRRLPWTRRAVYRLAGNLPWQVAFCIDVAFPMGDIVFPGDDAMSAAQNEGREDANGGSLDEFLRE